MSNDDLSRDFSEEAVKDFVEELENIVSIALPLDPADLNPEVELNTDNGVYVVELKVPLYYGRGSVEFADLNGQSRSDLYHLGIEYSFSSDRESKFLTTKVSKFEIRVHTQAAIRFEYERNKISAPAAHIHFSGIGGLLGSALMKNGRTSRKDTRKDGNIRSLHIPVGGHRFRPSLEDFLYFVIAECGFKGRNGWEARLKESRERWFDIQLQASVRDNPEVAADALRDLGFEVSAPNGGSPSKRRHDSW